MKQNILRKLMLIAVLLTSINAFAHDFEATNSDGVTIYYNITSASDLTVEVTYKGNSSTENTDRYTGSIVIPESATYNNRTYKVTSIGNSAFLNCVNLTSIAIPNTVTSINSLSFGACNSLTSITIPISVTFINERAFSPCPNLTSIIVESENTKYDSRGNCNAIIETSTNTLITGCKNTIIPNSVTSIGNGAFFYCSGLTSVTIPNSVTSIGYSAFAFCSGLTSVTIPNSVTFIPEAAFSGCSSLESIIVESGNTKYDSRNSCNAIIATSTNTLITGCKNTIIPNSVTSIGDYAFYNCSSLTTVTIPDSVTSISGRAFYNCYSLTSVTIGNSVTSIGNEAFSGCSELKKIICESVIPPTVYDYYQAFSNVTATLYVPVGSKEAYASAEGWNVFTNIVEMEFIEETTITIMDASNQGSVSFKYKKGEAFEFTVSPVTGYIVNTVLVNGDICEAENGTYNIESVSGETIISVSYEIDPETGVNTLSSNNLKVYGYNNTLTVLGAKNGGNISVFDMNGKLITSQKAFGENDTISLDNDGLYIVKVDNKSFKVIL